MAQIGRQGGTELKLFTSSRDEHSSIRKIAAGLGKFLRNVSKDSFAIFADGGGVFTFDERPRSQDPCQDHADVEVK
ncbi:hypothetical protein P0R31_23030 [Bradyrhizobium yuanmingense]|uniref:hypothetical protein n=1 Tax=Bradyrhizobium yuanmingense TaxID=108015 RepID=UPI0023BA04C5|nr:hypothetical protein [Bradyrhizobium yuanmingense]MDF0520121.1 hypothetical protein [Bradyrhizobium yuanmingense]